MSDFFGTEEKKDTSTIDGFFRDVSDKYPGLQTLTDGPGLKDKFPEFANKLGEALKSLKEKAAGEKRNKENSAEIDGYAYWFSTFNNKKQINRIPIKAGGGNVVRQSNVIIHQPTLLAFPTDKNIQDVLNEYTKPDKGLYTRIVQVQQNGAEANFVLEQFKLIKVPYDSIT